MYNTGKGSCDMVSVIHFISVNCSLCYSSHTSSGGIATKRLSTRQQASQPVDGQYIRPCQHLVGLPEACRKSSLCIVRHMSVYSLLACCLPLL
jgi:hypothetical protein